MKCTCRGWLQPCEYCLSDGPDPEAPVIDNEPDEWDNNEG